VDTSDVLFSVEYKVSKVSIIPAVTNGKDPSSNKMIGIIWKNVRDKTWENILYREWTITTFEKFYREPTSLSGDHTANNLRVLRFNTHTQGVTLNRSLWHHDHGWFFPGNGVCTRFSWYQISQLVWSPGEKLKNTFNGYIHTTTSLQSLSLISTSGTWFIILPHTTHTGCVFSLTPIVSLTISFRYFHKRFVRNLKSRPPLQL
jgi:hypothetical protein